MLITLILTAILSGLTVPKLRSEEILLPIENNGRTGFVNLHGKIVIQPIFRKVGTFSEGVAPARLEGLYGFIDTKGNYVIPPRYDYAESFRHGCAIVYNADGRARCINHSGKLLFSTSFRYIKPFHYCCSIARTTTENEGLIDLHGRLITDTLFRSIVDLGEGLFSARTKKKTTVILDTLGRIVLKFNHEVSVSKYHSGIAEFSYESGANRHSMIGALDKNGRKLFEKQIYYSITSENNFEYGKKVIDLTTPSGIYYKAVIDTTGTILINDSSFSQISTFERNVAYAVNSKKELCQIDDHGNITRTFPNFVLGSVSYIEFDHGIILLNTSSNKPSKQHFNYIMDSVGNIIYQTSDRYISSTKNPRYFISTLLSHRDEKPLIIDSWTGSIRGFADTSYFSLVTKDSYIIGYKQDTVAYFDYEGRLVHSFIEHDEFRSFHYDSDKNGVVSYRLSGADNIFPGHTLPVRFGSTQGMKNVSDTGISVFVVGIDTFNSSGSNSYDSGPKSALKIIVSNNSSRIFSISEYPGFIMQGKDIHGTWKDIESEEVFTCATGIRSVKIQPRQYVVFAGPIYEGSIKTKLRIKYYDRYLSNEFEGSVNPAQFWRNPDDFFEPE